MQHRFVVAKKCGKVQHLKTIVVSSDANEIEELYWQDKKRCFKPRKGHKTA
jgi:hypothetical protein